MPPGYFKDKIVFVGGRSTVGYLAAGRDEFGTPYSRRAHQFTTGLEVHATILLNLLREEWLTRMPNNWEAVVIILAGLIAGALAAVRPFFAVAAALIVSFAIACLACWSVWHQHVWFDWLMPAAVQMPLGLAWSVGSQYLLESRRRKELRRAFGFYLSPQMADKIADSDFDLKPGGKLVEVTIIFTDLESFTSITENLDPTEVSEILTSYFGQTTKCILENKGTIIKYIGDAVFAAWGAPIDEPDHAMRAAETACDLRCLSELVVHGKTLRTRVGIHSGKVLAGNLGSSYRFDYTMIGDAVNFASRLESLNKYLSTQVLISDAVRRQLGDGFVTRQLGRIPGRGQKAKRRYSRIALPLHCGIGREELDRDFREGPGRFSCRRVCHGARLHGAHSRDARRIGRPIGVLSEENYRPGGKRSSRGLDRHRRAVGEITSSCLARLTSSRRQVGYMINRRRFWRANLGTSNALAANILMC